MRRIRVSSLAVLLALPLFSVSPTGCHSTTSTASTSGAALVVAAGETLAELRVIKGDVAVTARGEAKRAPYPHERVADGTSIALAAGALAWIRRDGGALWLVAGPADLTLQEESVRLTRGRAFVDGEGGPPVRVESPRGVVELSEARASIELSESGAEDIYVLRGAVRAAASSERAAAGEKLTIEGNGKITRSAAVAWDDWTGGLATADPAAEPAPFGLGTVGARLPGDQGKPRFPLVIERLEVRVTIDHDLAITEVDQTFVNPSSDTVEGIFSFRTPPGAILHEFGVDRDGALAWGRVKESAEAQRQYQNNVSQGSTEDPALLAWVAPGIYNARLYPINAGAKRRVVTRYAEWLSRSGPRSERRVYTYPMAAEGAPGSLPRIEEMRVSLDLSRAGATRVRPGMHGRADGQSVVIQAFDFVPRADLSVELFDAGTSAPVAYRAPHALTVADIPMMASAQFAEQISSEEPDYLLLPVRLPAAPTNANEEIDLAIVVDTSAATEPGALAVARNLTSALLAHLGPADRVALWTGDATLRPVVNGSGELAPVTPEAKRALLAGLATVERGGATDLGALLTAAASKLDGKRKSAVIYVGDGLPSVGETSAKALHDRLARLPAHARIFAAGIGSRANLPLLDAITRGAPAEPVADAYGAARSALRLLEAANRPTWISTSLDLGSGVTRILPQDLPPISADESVLVVARITAATPTSIVIESDGQKIEEPLTILPVADDGDLRRRWGTARLAELLAEGAGRAALVDLGRRYSLVSPYTSLYVPTTREAERDEHLQREHLVYEHREALDRRRLWRPWWFTGHRELRRSFGAVSGESISGESRDPDAPIHLPTAMADNKEGGTGTRAKGEEGAMGNPRFGVEGPSDNADPHLARQGAMAEAAEFGMIGLVDQREDSSAAISMWGNDIGNSWGAGGLGLSGVGDGAGSIGHGAGNGSGNGYGRLGGSHMTKSPSIRQAATQVNGRLPPEVIQRIVRQNFGRFRLCYENGLRTKPTLAGRIVAKFVIDRSGAVASASDGGSDLPDSNVVSCVIRNFGNLAFPQPEGGIVTVVYPIDFQPADDAHVAMSTAALGVIGHSARPCGAAAELPIHDRRALWSERLAAQSTGHDAEQVYRHALEQCEAPSWQERTGLLVMMVNRLPSVRERVALWKELALTPAADVVYRAILVRISTVTDLRELHDALGLDSVDPDLLAGMLKKAKTPADRLSVLRAAATKWSDDLELALRVLDAYEDAGDDAGGRAWARHLRRRADATAHVWMSVGEYYLRLAARGSADAEHDEVEARRTFGELVELAPDDPAARRRLGDLLLAHGWYEEGLRQYLTLQTLTPEDPLVSLLLASAAQGLGRIEEAVGHAEKAASAGSPDGKSALSRAARATASAFLAAAETLAIAKGNQPDADRLTQRAQRLLAASGVNDDRVRVIVTWSHPELHPALWTTSLGAAMPAPDNFPQLGVAEARLAAGQAFEIRLEPEDAARAARLGLHATVTAIAGEGRPNAKIARQELSFGSVSAPLARQSLTLRDGTITVGAAP